MRFWVLLLDGDKRRICHRYVFFERSEAMRAAVLYYLPPVAMLSIRPKTNECFRALHLQACQGEEFLQRYLLREAA